jgi:hypothetical protein
MGLYEIKKLLHNKKMVSKLKKPPTEWEKIFASYTSDKRLIARIYRELKKLNSPKLNEPNRIFSKEEVQMAKKKQTTTTKNT